jgi:alpha-L-rhamnosidase
MMEPIRVVDTLRPATVTESAPGTYIFDMGQNLVGWCRLTVSGPEGTRVSMRHSETLKPDGTLYLDNIRSARVTDVYTLKGKGVEVYEPRFTYHGFRYVEVKGFPGKPALSSIEGRVVHDDMERAGSFSTSKALLNGIYGNIAWGVRGNYRSIPTDCPQRDERQGWLGDRSAESRGEMYLFNVAAFYSKWMTDIQDAQLDSGSVPDVAPPYWAFYSDNVTWPSSYIIIPGHLYDQYGDTRVLERHYPTMKKWIRHMSGYIRDGIMPRDTYGDWCVPPEEQHLIHSKDPTRKTAGDLIGTAYFVHDLRLMARYAGVMGKRGDATEWTGLADEMEKAFLKRFFKPDSALFDNGSQTSSVLPLAFGMVREQDRSRVFHRLVEKIEVEGKGHIGTGLLGAQWLLRLLSDGGRPDLAYGMAVKTDYPSWGYMLLKGATTIWELWNGDTADPAMNSGNHVMLVGDLLIWLHEYVAGIRPDPESPGFKHIIVRPHPLGDLTEASATRRTLHGTVSVAWKIAGGRFTLALQVPPNTSATLQLPERYSASVREGSGPAGETPGVQPAMVKDGGAVYRVGSGSYQFSSESSGEVKDK